MTRVSENSATAALNYSLGKTKSALENLNLQGANLRKIQKPSDNPSGNADLLSIRSRTKDAKQYERNATFAKAQLSLTEISVASIADIISKVKEIAIGQSSSYYDLKVRKAVAFEVDQLRTQALSIANKRLGNRYIFGGHRSLTKPFDQEGHYYGDDGKVHLEIFKDVFVPINFNGKETFFEEQGTKDHSLGPLEGNELSRFFPEDGEVSAFDEERGPANTEPKQPKYNPQEIQKTNIFDHLESLRNALMTNNHKIIQDLLPILDEDFDRLNALRAKIGALINTVENAELNQEKEYIVQEEKKSRIEDADVAELFTSLNKQKNVLKATYKSGSSLLNTSLLDFIR